MEGGGPRRARRVGPGQRRERVPSGHGAAVTLGQTQLFEEKPSSQPAELSMARLLSRTTRITLSRAHKTDTRRRRRPVRHRGTASASRTTIAPAKVAHATRRAQRVPGPRVIHRRS